MGEGAAEDRAQRGLAIKKSADAKSYLVLFLKADCTGEARLKREEPKKNAACLFLWVLPNPAFAGELFVSF